MAVNGNSPIHMIHYMCVVVCMYIYMYIYSIVIVITIIVITIIIINIIDMHATIVLWIPHAKWIIHKYKYTFKYPCNIHRFSIFT